MKLDYVIHNMAKGILGRFLIDSKATKYIEDIPEEIFKNLELTVFKSIKKLVKQGCSIDINLVMLQMGKDGQKLSQDLELYLFELTREAPGYNQFQDYLRQLQNNE